MKRKLLLAALFVASAFSVTQAQQDAQKAAPYFSADQVKETLDNATTVSDLTTFQPLSGNYTIEVQGTAGTEITFPLSTYVAASYTPEATGTVRFVAAYGNVFVYEGKEYKGTVKQVITYPEVTENDVNSEVNILKDGDFNDTSGGTLGTYTDRYALGESWFYYPENLFGDGGSFRVASNSYAHESTTPNVLVWRMDNNSYPSYYFGQSVKLSPNGYYRAVLRNAQHNQDGDASYNFRLGSTQGGNEYSDGNITVKKNETAAAPRTVDLTTPAEIAEQSYFSVHNNARNTSSNNGVSQFDYIMLVEANHAVISGATDFKYVEDAAYVPAIEGEEITDDCLKDAAVTDGTGWTGVSTNNITSGNAFPNAPDDDYFNCNWASIVNISQKFTLPAGKYILKAATCAAEGLKKEQANIYANSKTYGNNSTECNFDGSNNGDLGNGWSYTNVAFELRAEEEVSIGFYADTRNLTQKWARADDFHLYKVADIDFATKEDIQAFNDELTKAESNTLGFEDGEYAPYNNIDALTTLTKVKEFSTEGATHDEVVEQTSALQEASWTANEGSVDAVYNGNFSEKEGNAAKGWTQKSGHNEQVTYTSEDEPNGTAWYCWQSGMQYGNNGYYTMPLKGKTIYHLTVKYAAQSSTALTPKVSVLNGADGMPEVAFASTKTLYTDGFEEVNHFFITGEEGGDYILSISGNTNMAITGISLKKDEAQTLVFADGAVPSYTPNTYPAVKVARTLTADKWATAVYPFAISGEDLTIATLKSLEDGVLSFETAGTSEANVPFLMKAASTEEAITLTDVEVAAASVTNATVDGVALKGTYTATEVTKDDTEAYVYYVLSNNELRKINEVAATVPAYRAWFEVSTSEDNEAGLRISFDGGEATAIDTVVKSATVGNGKVYDLSGREVSTPTRGLYIINGQKVMIK